MHRTLRRLALVSAAAALVVAPSFAASADTDDSEAYVSARVVGSDGQDLRGVELFLTQGKDWTYVGTSADGGILTSRHDLWVRAGEYRAIFGDITNEYAPVEMTVDLEDGTTNVGTVTLDPASTVTGTVTSPSGKKLKNVKVTLLKDPDDPYAFDGGVDTSDSLGRFVVPGLGTGEFHASVSTDGNAVDHGLAEVEEHGTTVSGVAVTGVKVTPTVKALPTSSKKRQITLKVSMTAASYGLSNPGGKVDVYVGSKRVKSAVSLVSGKRTITLTGIAKGSHTVHVKYLGATDTYSKSSASHSVKVK